MAAGLAGASAIVVGCRGGEGGGNTSAGVPPSPSPPPDTLSRDLPLPQFTTLPSSTDGDTFTGSLVAAPGSASFSPGNRTPLLLYNDSAPGPLIDLREGQRVRISVHNALAHETTIHWHGLPVAPEQDGNPMDPIPAGAVHEYDYTLPRGCAGTYWYHPHPHDATATQVASGLAGPLVIRADDDPLAHLPEQCLLISGVRLAADGTIAPHDSLDWTAGRQDTLLVNGARVPRLELAPGATQRWRIINASASRHFRVALESHTMTLVGTDGGLLAAPVPDLTEVLLSPAQRIEVVVTLKASPNATYRLRALRYQTDVLNFVKYVDDDLLTVVTTAEPALAPLPIPRNLRPIADLGTPALTQHIELGETTDLCTSRNASVIFLINGKTFDPQRVDLVSRVGRVELWEIVNLTGMAHPFHIHGVQFQLVSRRVGQVTTPAPYLAWIDTVMVPPLHAATIKVRQDFAGKRMFHCHILEHEDNCMMAILDVLA